jgi:hypothetical protein
MEQNNLSTLFLSAWEYTKHDFENVKIKLKQLSGIVTSPCDLPKLSFDLQMNVLLLDNEENPVYGNPEFLGTICILLSDNTFRLSRFYFFGNVIDFQHIYPQFSCKFHSVELNNPAICFTFLCSKRFERKHFVQLDKDFQNYFSQCCYKLRHDLVVSAVFKCLAMRFQKERTICSLFPELTGRIFANKTPDIIVRQGLTVQIFEITVSVAANEAFKNKVAKYDPIVSALRDELKLAVQFHVISITPEFVGLTKRLTEIFPKNYQTSNYSLEASSLCSSLDNSLKVVKPYFTLVQKKGVNEANTGRLRAYEDIIVPLNPLAVQMENDAILGVQEDATYLHVLEGLFEDGELVKQHKIPTHFSKQIPKHCDPADILKVGVEMPDFVKNNFETLPFAAPSLHFAIPVDHLVYPKTSEKISEEDQIFSLAKQIYSVGLETKIPAFCFLYEILKKIMDLEQNEQATSIFKTGYPDAQTKTTCLQYKVDIEKQYIERSEKEKGVKRDKAIRILTEQERKEYKIYLEAKAKQEEADKETISLQSKKYNNIFKFSRSKFIQSLVSTDVTNYTLHHKCIKQGLYDASAKTFFEEAHISFKKPLKEELPFNFEKKSKSLIPMPEDHACVEKLLYDWSEQSTDTHIPAPDYLFTSKDCHDNLNIMNFKEIIHQESNPTLRLLLGTKWAEFAYRSSLFAQQLIHFGSFTNRFKHFFFCTTGIENVCCIAAGTKHKPSTDPGVPFLFFGKIPEGATLNPLFGHVEYLDKPGHGCRIFITNWRRLKLEKLTHMRDVFFSTLSSGFKNLCIPKTIDLHHTVENYSFRVLAGCSVSQKVAEFLADFKHISMASLSEFSKTDVLIKDKIKGPFTKHIEVYLFYQQIKKSLQTMDSLKHNPIQINEYYETEDKDVELDFSIGGTISLPFLWAKEGTHTDLNTYLDCVHTYVHTVKEPASNFHESVKSLKTVLKFNNKYKALTKTQRAGQLKTAQDHIELLDDNTMGFSAKFLSDAMKHFHNTRKIDYKELLTSNVFFVPIAQFSSTKSSILDPRRPEKDTFRMKVIDALLVDQIGPDVNFSIGNNLLQHAAMVVNNQDLKPLADMCIKVQYGPKREFYVLDVYFKFALKFLEEFFKLVCKEIPTECISVPGDLKLLRIQNVNHKARHYSSVIKTPQFFINGDCSKWSASELMESFAVIILELKTYLPQSVYNIFMNILALWKEKRLQIEPRFIDKITKTSLTEDLFNGDSRIYHLKMPQNFLMGLFNYLSSFKAVVVFEYTKHLLQVKKPKLLFKHLEHSDDYTIATVEEKDKIPALKTFVTATMRFGSITDSDKKTVISNWYQEFVSLFTFNGVMTYPQIKKTKEISSAVTGMGYYQDSATIGSRVAEVVRIGCTNQVALIFLKIHNWLLQHLYSMMQGQNNDAYRTAMISPFSVPTQAFGLSECWPVLYLLADGDPNNFRLARYYSNQSLLKELAKRDDDTFEESLEGCLSLYSPDFLKTFSSYKLRKVKKAIQFDPEKSKQFWQDHASYKFIKPKFGPYLVDYLKAFFLLRSFTLAYTRQSKLAVVLRISTFIRRPCIGYRSDARLYTIKELQMKFVQIFKQEYYMKDFKIDPRFLTEGSIAPILFDKIITASRPKIGTRDPHYFKSVASKMPKPYEQVHIDNNPADVIQFFYNKQDYMLDGRTPLPNSNIEADSKIVEQMDSTLKLYPLMERLNYIYNCLTKDKKKVRICLTPSPNQRDLIRFVTDSFLHGFCASKTCQIKVDTAIKFDGPLGETPLRFLYSGQQITQYHCICKTIMTLAIYIRLKTADNENYLMHIIENFNRLYLAAENKSLYSFLEQLSLSQMDINGLTQNEVQSMLVLQKLICQRTDQVERFASQYTTIVYKYDLSASLINSKYVGDSIISFSIFDAVAKMIHLDAISANILITNSSDLSKILMLFNAGIRFVSKKDFTLWESAKILEKIAQGVIRKEVLLLALEKYIGRDFLRKSAYNKWKIVCKDERGLFLRQIERSIFSNKDLLILPIVVNPDLMSGSMDDSLQHAMDSDLVIDERNWSLKTKSGNWVVARFSIHDFYTNDTIFSNTNEFHFQKVNWKFLIKECTANKIYLKKGEFAFHDPKHILESLDIQALPDVNIETIRQSGQIFSKLNNFDLHFPNACSSNFKKEFPSFAEILKEPNAEQIKTITDDENLTSEEKFYKIYPFSWVQVEDDYIPDADNYDDFVKHREEIRAGSKKTYGKLADRAIKIEEELNPQLIDDDPIATYKPPEPIEPQINVGNFDPFKNFNIPLNATEPVLTSLTPNTGLPASFGIPSFNLQANPQSFDFILSSKLDEERIKEQSNSNKYEAVYLEDRQKMDKVIEQMMEEITDKMEKDHEEKLAKIKQQNFGEDDIKRLKDFIVGWEEQVERYKSLGKFDVALTITKKIYDAKKQISDFAESSLTATLKKPNKAVRERVPALKKKEQTAMKNISLSERNLAKKQDELKEKPDDDSVKSAVKRAQTMLAADKKSLDKISKELLGLYDTYQKVKPSRNKEQRKIIRDGPYDIIDRERQIEALSRRIQMVKETREIWDGDKDLKEARILALNAKIAEVRNEIQIIQTQMMSIIETTEFYEDDLDYFEQRFKFSLKSAENKEIFERVKEYEKTFFSAKKDLEPLVKILEEFIESPYLPLPDFEPLDTLFASIPFAIAIPNKGEREKVESIRTKEFNENILLRGSHQREVIQLASTMNIIFKFNLNLNKNQDKIISDFKDVTKESGPQGKKAQQVLIKLFKKEILKESTLSFNELLFQKIKFLNTLSWDQPNPFIELQNLEDSKLLKSRLEGVLTNFQSNSNMDYLKSLKAVSPKNDEEIQNWLNDQENLLLRLPKDEELENAFIKRTKFRQDEKRLKRLYNEIFDLESGIKKLISTMDGDDETMAAVFKINTAIMAKNKALDSEAKEKIKIAKEIENRISIYREIVDPKVNEIESFLSQGVSDSLFLDEIEKSAIKTDMSKIKLHTIYNMAPKTDFDGFKYLTRHVNNTTEAWQDVTRSIAINGLRDTTGFKTIAVLHTYLSLTRSQHIKSMTKINKILWNSITDMIANQTFRDNVECFEERTSLAVTLSKTTRKIEFWQYKLASKTAVRKGETNLGSYDLSTVIGIPFFEPSYAERSFEFFMPTWTRSVLAKTLDVDTRCPILDVYMELISATNEV